MQNENKSKVCIDSNDQTVRTTLKAMDTPEHTKVYSRTLRRDLEIGVGMHGTAANGDWGGLVPSNPFASQAQAGYLHAHPEKVGGESKLKEWDSSTNFNTLPKKAKK